MRNLAGLRVASGYAVGLLAIALARPTGGSVVAGLSVALLGEIVRLWASGHIEKSERLATGGPYAHTRNPLYVGSALLAVGFAIAAASAWVVLAVIAYFAAFYPAVIAEESRFIRGKFGAEYDAWAQAVPAFLPRLFPAGPRTSQFAWARVARNREWRTAIALPLLGLLLYWRARL
jgi:protein-S-isoprenylcysteine O-methyltransferase Ste14